MNQGLWLWLFFPLHDWLQMLRFLLLNVVQVLAAMMFLERTVAHLEIQNDVLIQEEDPIPELSDG